MTEAGELVGGRYRLREIVGIGGMGRVWLAEDELLGRAVAVKEMLGLDNQARTVREARAAARLDHPGVVKVFDVVWRDGRAWIVMEYVRSRSLHVAIQSDGPLSHRSAARIGLRVLAALRAAHTAGVLHLDVKPHNVLLGDDGRVVLGDFGLAVTRGGDGGPEPELMGSPYYVAPERITPGGRPSPATDLWSLGATLFAATEGQPPFLRASTEESLRAVLRESPSPSRFPGPLTPVLLDLLVKDRDGRPNPVDLERQLRRVAEDVVRPARGSAPVRRAPSSLPPASTSLPAPASTSLPAPASTSLPAPASSSLPAPASSSLPGPARSSRSRRRVYLVAGAVVALVGASGAAILLDGQRSPAEPASRPSQAMTTLVAPAPPIAGSACGTGTETGPIAPAKLRIPAGLPSGWVWFRDPTGFTLALPAGWKRSMSGTAVCFQNPGGDAAFTVDSAALVTRKPLDYFQSQEKAAPLPGYKRISMDVLLLRRGGADWEYTWRPDSDSVQHVRRVLLAVTDQRSYLLKWATSDRDWARDVRLQRQLVTLFDSAS
jgi:serine/threonine protein kinase